MCAVACVSCKFCILIMNSEREGLRICVNKKSELYAKQIPNENVEDIRDCEVFEEGISIC